MPNFRSPNNASTAPASATRQCPNDQVVATSSRTSPLDASSRTSKLVSTTSTSPDAGRFLSSTSTFSSRGPKMPPPHHPARPPRIERAATSAADAYHPSPLSSASARSRSQHLSYDGAGRTVLATGTTSTADPRRAKLRHAATAPSHAFSAASADRKPHPCPQCRSQQSQFYCDTCLSRRVADHHREIQRLSQARDKARTAVQCLLGLDSDSDHDAVASVAAALRKTASPVSSISRAKPRFTHSTIEEEDENVKFGPPSVHELPDPFGEAGSHDAQDSPSTNEFAVPRLGILSTVRLRSRVAQLNARLHEIRSAIDESRASHLQGIDAIAEKRCELKRRWENLHKVRINTAQGASSQDGNTGYGAGAVPINDLQSMKSEAVARTPRFSDRWRPQRNPGAWPGDDPNFNIDTFDGHPWSTDVYQRGERCELDGGDAAEGNEDKAAVSSDPDAGASLGLAALVEWLRADLGELRQKEAAAAEELQRTRAILAKEAFDIFAIQAPAGSDLWDKIRPPSAVAPPNLATNRRGASTGRSPSLTERYMPGAFAFGRDVDRFANNVNATSNVSNNGAVPSSNRRPSETLDRDMKEGRKSGRTGEAGAAAAATPVAAAVNPNDWSIAGLVLPLPNDVRRFPRDSTNGAIAHTVHLLQLLTSYLGISLPFAIGIQGGKVSIRPNSMWDGGGGSSKQALHLSSAAYAVLSAPPASIGSGTASRLGLGESTFSLGASTLSTLESFIQLPPRSHFSWALASTLAGPTAKGEEKDEAEKRGSLPSEPSPTSLKPEDRSGRADGASGEEAGRKRARSQKSDAGTQAARAFCAALVMLSYDLAYLASTQGVKVDLVSAGGSGLRLLHLAIQNPQLGFRAHANSKPQTEIKDLAFHGLDYDQLVQLLEPMKASSTKSYPATSSHSSRKTEMEGEHRSRPPPSSPSSFSSSSRALLEQSYVDAKEAAASVLDIRDPSKLGSGRVPRDALSESNARPDKVGKTDRTDGKRSAGSRVFHSASPAAGSSSSSSSNRGITVRSGVVHSGLDPCRVVDGKASKLRRGESAHETPTGAHPTSLDFLRRRGQDVGIRKAEVATATRIDSPTDTSVARQVVQDTETAKRKSLPSRPATTTGAVIFNGIELSGSSSTARDSARGSVSGEACRESRPRGLRTNKLGEVDDEGWDLV